MIELLSNLMPLIVTVIVFLVLYFRVLPQWKKGWNNEKKDLARKIAKEIISKKK
jgi:hypothetical protein